MVSVIIVSWNASDYLLRCLQSLSRDVCRFPVEIIVVDNASSDGSVERVEELFPEVRLIRNSENLGFARASNLGVAVSRGRYLCFINSDVEVRNDCVTRLVTFCEGNPEVGMVGPGIIGRDGRPQTSCRTFPTLWNTACRAFALDKCFPHVPVFDVCPRSRLPPEAPRTVDVLSGCFWLVRKDALGTVGMLDESFFMYGEDVDWCKRFRTAGWKIVFFPGAEAIHHGGASSANAPLRFYIEKQKADLRYWAKHHSASGIRHLLPGCLFAHGDAGDRAHAGISFRPPCNQGPLSQGLTAVWHAWDG